MLNNESDNTVGVLIIDNLITKIKSVLACQSFVPQVVYPIWHGRVLILKPTYLLENFSS